MHVHKATISIAVADGARGGEVRHFGNFPNRADHVSKLVERLSKTDGERLRFCYEAGPCGYGLHRQITDLGHECAVVAPSLIPRKAGDRIKTDRRDAVMLAKLHRAGELTAMWVPDAAHEAIRDLIRARATAVRALGKARQHLQGFLTPRSRTPGRGLGSKYDGPAAKVQLKAEWKRWRGGDRRGGEPSPPVSPLQKRIDWLGEVCELNPSQRLVLGLLARIARAQQVRKLVGAINQQGKGSEEFDLPELRPVLDARVDRRGLSGHGLLTRFGLIEKDDNDNFRTSSARCFRGSGSRRSKSGLFCSASRRWLRWAGMISRIFANCAISPRGWSPTAERAFPTVRTS